MSLYGEVSQDGEVLRVREELLVGEVSWIGKVS